MKPNRTLLTLATESRLDKRRAQVAKRHKLDRNMQRLLRMMVALNFKYQKGGQ